MTKSYFSHTLLVVVVGCVGLNVELGSFYVIYFFRVWRFIKCTIKIKYYNSLLTMVTVKFVINGNMDSEKEPWI